MKRWTVLIVVMTFWLLMIGIAVPLTMAAFGPVVVRPVVNTVAALIFPGYKMTAAAPEEIPPLGEVLQFPGEFRTDVRRLVLFCLDTPDFGVSARLVGRAGSGSQRAGCDAVDAHLADHGHRIVDGNVVGGDGVPGAGTVRDNGNAKRGMDLRAIDGSGRQRSRRGTDPCHAARMGHHRCGGGNLADLESGVFQGIAQPRSAKRGGLPNPVPDCGESPGTDARNGGACHFAVSRNLLHGFLELLGHCPRVVNFVAVVWPRHVLAPDRKVETSNHRNVRSANQCQHFSPMKADKTNGAAKRPA